MKTKSTSQNPRIILLLSIFLVLTLKMFSHTTLNIENDNHLNDIFKLGHRTLNNPNSTNPALPGLRVIKSINTPASQLGGVITYDIEVINTGDAILSDVYVTDANADSISGSLIGQLMPGEVAIVTATHTITQADIDAGYVENSAIATGSSPGGVDNVSDVSDAGDETVETPNGDGTTDGDPTNDPTVLVITTTPPTGIAPEDVTLECIADVIPLDLTAVEVEAGSCGTLPEVTATENSNASIGGTGCNGTPLIITRTFTLTDSCGNSSDLTQTITVEDVTPPTASNPIAITVGSIADIPQANINVVTDEADNCTLVPSVSHISDTDNSGSGTSSDPLIITRTYSVTDNCGNSTDLIQTITVSGNTSTPPTGIAPEDVTLECIADVIPLDLTAVEVEAGSCGTLPEVTATENSNASIGGTGCNGTPLIITRTFTLTDSCGNSSDLTQTITVEDVTPPTGIAPADITDIECIADVPQLNLSYITDESDNCMANVVITASETTNAASGCNGTPLIITRTYTLTDGCGNSSDLTQTITVEDVTPPTASNPIAITVGSIADIPQANINVVTDEADNCTLVPSVSHVSDTDNGGSGTSTDPLIITRTYSVTDNCGNSTDLIQTITVQGENPQSLVADLSVVVESDLETTNIGSEIFLTVTVINSGPNEATGVELTDILPVELSYVTSIVSMGYYDELSGLWSIGTIDNGGQAILKIIANSIESGEIINVAEITAVNESDPDSTPNNYDENEDDFSYVSINVYPEIIFPQGFSPNNDGINDFYEVPNLEILYPNFNITIFRNNGKEIFEYAHNGDPNSEPLWWDGNWKKNNNRAPKGVYYYIVNFNDGLRSPYMGWFYLSR